MFWKVLAALQPGGGFTQHLILPRNCSVVATGNVNPAIKRGQNSQKCTGAKVVLLRLEETHFQSSKLMFHNISAVYSIHANVMTNILRYGSVTC